MITTEDERQKEFLKHFRKIAKANQEGYAGCLPNGNLVDRRECNEAFPVAANTMFKITNPRCVKCSCVTPINELVKSLCRDCRNAKNLMTSYDGADLTVKA